MKQLFLLTGLSIALLSCGNVSNNTEVEESAAPTILGYFGDTITFENALSSAQFMDLLAENDSAVVKVSATINDVCKKKGCWMTLDMGDEKELLVRFKDYGFFVPKNAEGLNATIEGVAKKTVISIDELKHLAEDAGKSQDEIDAIVEPKVKLAFEATGVILTE
ncbi:MAG: DUF4920 domain-containing protein [Luteibaculaceae bacterium]